MSKESELTTQLAILLGEHPEYQNIKTLLNEALQEAFDDGYENGQQDERDDAK